MRGYYPKYKGKTNTSLISGLEAVGEKDLSREHIVEIAKKNGFPNYSGTNSENSALLTLLRTGGLKK